MTRAAILAIALLLPAPTWGAALCPPVRAQPPALFMAALEATESGGARDPDSVPGDDGESWGRYQVSVIYAVQCLREEGRSVPWPLPVDRRARIITMLLHPPTQREWALRHAEYCLAQYPPGWWSMAYRCYRGGPGAKGALGPNERRFAANVRRIGRHMTAAQP